MHEKGTKRNQGNGGARVGVDFSMGNGGRKTAWVKEV